MAEKGLTKIAVEVKSFINPSMIHDFLRASGQYYGYNIVIKRKKIDRILYIAMPSYAYKKLIKYEFIQAIVDEMAIKFILFDEKEKIITAWKE